MPRISSYFIVRGSEAGIKGERVCGPRRENQPWFGAGGVDRRVKIVMVRGMAAYSSHARLSRWLALLAVTMVAVYLSWKLIEPFMEVLLLGVALAVIFRPWHLRFMKWTGKPVVAAGLSTLFTLLVLVVPMAFVSLTLVKEVPGAIASLQSGAETVQAKWAADAGADSWLATVRRDWELDEVLGPEKLREYGGQLTGFVLKNAVNVVGGVLGFFLNSVFLVFVLFYLFRDGG